MGDAFHAACTDILVDLVDAHVGFDGDGSVWASGGAACALDTGLEFGRLLLEVPCEALHVCFGIDDGEA